MSRISFENYGKCARELSRHTEIVGRYPIQKEAERRIILDVVEKLEVQPTDSILDIGCGTGSLTIPLSFICQHITGIDHVDVLSRMQSRCSEIENLHLIPGNFLDLTIDNKFDKVMVYSVLHYLTHHEEVIAFIDKILELIYPGGRCLFGDIPNSSLKKRFIRSEHGKEFLKAWEKEIENHPLPQEIDLIKDQESAEFDDEAITQLLLHIRLKGFHAYILDQPESLPFGYTREDLLIIHPEQKPVDPAVAQ